MGQQGQNQGQNQGRQQGQGPGRQQEGERRGGWGERSREHKLAGLDFREALEVEFPSGLFTDNDDAVRAFYELVALSNEGAINLVAPTKELDRLPDLMALSITPIEPKIDYLYELPGGGDKWGISKLFLDQLKAVRGISIVDTYRSDDRADDCIWQWTCEVVVPMLNGSSVRVKKSRMVDMRDGGADLAKALGKDWAQKRHLWMQTRGNGPALAESKAALRAIREALGVEASMYPAAFMKPWAVVAVAPYMPVGMLSQAAKDAIGIAMYTGGNALAGRQAAEAYRTMTTVAPAAAALPPAQEQAPASEDKSPADKPTDKGTRSPPATAAQIESLNKAFGALGEVKFYEVADATFGGGGMPDAKTITAPDAERFLVALRAAAAKPAAQPAQQAPKDGEVPF